MIELLSNCFLSQICTTGFLSFNYVYYWRPKTLLSINVPLIAPFWVSSIQSGHIFYRQTNDTTLLQRARDQLQELFPSSGNFTPTTLFIATWDRVAQFEGATQVSTYKTVCHLSLCRWGLTSRASTIVVVIMLYQYDCAVTVDCNQKMHYFYRQTHSRL